jgi:hypothetical protein
MQPQAPTPPQPSFLSKLTSLDHKDVLVRALKTAVAAFVATLLITSQPYSKQALIAATSAAATALLNYTLQLTK